MSSQFLRRLVGKRWVRLFGLCLAIAMIVSIVPGCAGEEEATPTPTGTVEFQERTLVYTSFMSDSTLAAQGDIAFWEYVEEETDGAVQVDWRFNGELNPSSEQQSTVIETGIADMGQWSPVYAPARFPLGGIFSPLFITDKPDLTGKATIYLMDNFAPWQDEMSSNNLKLLTGYGTGPVQIAGTTGEIHSLEDIAGKKYRATAFLGEAWGGLGGVPVTVAGSEIYNSVAQGTVEGVILALEHLNVFHLDEYLEFVAGGSGFGIYANTMMAMNLDTWNDFEPELQQICMDAREVAVAKHAALASEQDQAIYDAFKAAGVHMYKLDPVEAQRLKDALLPDYWDGIKESSNEVDPNFGAMMDMYAQFCEDHADESTYVDPFEAE